MEQQNLQPRPTILVVDDTVSNLTLLCDLLKPHYRVKATTRGDAVHEIALSNDPPALILLDIMMPDMSGFEVCEQLKAVSYTHLTLPTKA